MSNSRVKECEDAQVQGPEKKVRELRRDRPRGPLSYFVQDHRPIT